MRVLLSLVLVLLVAGAANASHVSLTNRTPQQHKGYGDGASHQTLSGGESFGTATVIPSLPYTDSGATCGMSDDITPCCSYSAAPDAFYSYTPSANGSINVSLCGSGYDTILAIYDSASNCLACNDDFCGLQSEIDNFSVTGGQTYYFVVDGYSTSCGSYMITVTPNLPCVVTCPAGALIEGEPDCYDGYVDMYNGGCNSTPQVFQNICPQAGTSAAVMCGKSGTYLYQGLSYRDTDWYQVYGNGGTLTETCEADFPLQLIFIYGTNCASPLYDYTTANPCQSVSLSRTVGAAVGAWMWVGPSQFNGVPCGSSNYVLSLSGISCGAVGACCMPDHSCQVLSSSACEAAGGVYQGDGTQCTPGLCNPTAVEQKTWGTVKGLYR